MTAIAVATAVCVVTCPCAIGIAIPLAYELTHSRLRKRGLFVREGSFLDRALDVRRVVFDKTGTLTTGRLRLENPETLSALDPEARELLYNLCARSLHPRSIALRRQLSSSWPELRFVPELEVSEQPGLGLELAACARSGGHRYRLGRADWALSPPAAARRADSHPASPDPASDAALVFARDGRQLSRFETAEVFRPDAAREVAALQRAGFDVHILSGDRQAAVERGARALGISPQNAHGEHDPDSKAAFIAAHAPEQTLMIGDGINDALAVARAGCSGTPSIERAFLPARSDFYFTTPGLSPVSAALQAARDVRAVVRFNLVFAVTYNALAAAAALAGLMQPWLAAVLMPLSSIAVVARTSATLARRSRAWRS